MDLVSWRANWNITADLFVTAVRLLSYNLTVVNVLGELVRPTKTSFSLSSDLLLLYRVGQRNPRFQASSMAWAKFGHVDPL